MTKESVNVLAGMKQNWREKGTTIKGLSTVAKHV